jgi:hypothetical protein
MPPHVQDNDCLRETFRPKRIVLASLRVSLFVKDAMQYAATSVGKGATSAGKDVTVGTVKGTGKGQRYRPGVQEAILVFDRRIQ